MSFKIIVDSCCDFPEAQFKKGTFLRVPLTLELGDKSIVDDETFDQTQLLWMMRTCPDAPKTACPSPAVWLDAFEAAGADDLYVVTLSALLSGSHNSAHQARTLWLEEHPNAHLHIFNSCSASAGEIALALRIRELAEAGLDFSTVVSRASTFTTELKTYFVLEDLDHLRKNGRLTGALSVITGALRIKLLMGATPEGEICKVGQALSVKQALGKMVELMAKDPDHEGRTLSIVHCNNVERAFYLKEQVLSACKFRRVLVSDARGVTTVYANDGGVVAAY